MDDDAHSALDDPCFLLDLLAGELESRGLSARDLVAITFTEEREQIAVATRLHPLPQRYPELAEILEQGSGKIAKEGLDRETLVKRLYRRALSREPSAEERQLAIDTLGEKPTAEGISDLVWMIIMLPEFQHVQ